MTNAETLEDDFPGELFPASFTLLYCPVEACAEETPFKDPMKLVEHLAECHSITIREPKQVIPFLDRYIAELLKESPHSPSSLEDDAVLRHRLQQERLTEVLAQQASERQDSHRRGQCCLFCATHYCPTKADLFAHMFHHHGLNIGQLDNLVWVDEFLAILQGKLANHICIYCEKTFPNMPTLKKHLKNKNHYRIHPKNHIYDRFYIVNYLQVGKLYDAESENASQTMDEPMGGTVEGEEQWDELIEGVEEQTMCLLCSHTEDDTEKCIDHMLKEHDFDWNALISTHQVTNSPTTNTNEDKTYSVIKIINYIRLRIAENTCIYCNHMAEDEELLLTHLQSTHKPFTLPDERMWKDVRYMFPVYDDDPMLCYTPLEP